MTWFVNRCYELKATDMLSMLFPHKINQNDELAIKLKEILASGKLVSDDILNSIVSDKIINDCRNGFILDGYPRTLDQSSYLNNLMDKQNLKLDYIFNIEIEFSILKDRIVSMSTDIRWSSSKSFVFAAAAAAIGLGNVWGF